jgi:translation initiation factor 3 subunit J
MSDNWDDSDDEWDKSDDEDELDKRLGLAQIDDNAPPAAFDEDEEDLTLKDKERDDKANEKLLKAKGSALAKKKEAEAAAKEELELAKKAMEMEAEMEANMTPEERRELERERQEADAMEMADDLFGGVDNSGPRGPGGPGSIMMSGDKVVMKDLKDHLRHAKKVGECIQGHGKINLCSAFLKEVIQQCKDVLDDDAITDVIKTCNIIKNEKVQQAKKKVKGQAQKSKKADKEAKKKAMDIHNDVFGDNDNYDKYDDMGGAYEDDFF